MKQVILIYLLLIITTVSKASTVIPTVAVIDTTDLILKIDDNIIIIDKSVLNKKGWGKILTGDHFFVSYFQKNSTQAVYINIKEVEQIDSLTFRCKILNRPVKPESYTSNGWCNYYLTCSSNINNRKLSITEIKFRGCEI